MGEDGSFPLSLRTSFESQPTEKAPNDVRSWKRHPRWPAPGRGTRETWAHTHTHSLLTGTASKGRTGLDWGLPLRGI